ncbi:Porin Gram-negative type [Candidatus Propionivibrio aalborgensis]|uniref:Porin Gram-negative type n=2 Tax=Candidatus Propionivibrio aalborgensis TaxID=1860101 RepID=A0A1A8XV60_9RHOO|nr:porin [Candidatus Propionivibrio aalborgensis]SBT08477.1 Porin Gram-negative type [Candidatus Propionivibrio aalborgensis]
MQKKLIALAVAGLVSGAAFAQSNVTVYGIVDAGFVNSSGDRSGTNQGSANYSGIDSGIWAGSRIGFKGEEGLGNGLKAIFTLEYYIAPDINSGLGSATDPDGAGATTSSSRQTFVGLNSAKLGTVALGRQYAPGYAFSVRNDPQGGATISALSTVNTAGANSISAGSRARINNAVTYASPNWSGFTANAIYGYGEGGGSTTNGVSQGNDGFWGAGLNYANGPLNLDVVYQSRQGITSTLIASSAATQDSVNEWALGGTYDFKVVKLYATYLDQNDNNGTSAQEASNRVWSIGASAPVFTNGKVSLGYADVSWDRSGAGSSSSWSLAYQHSLSKRTTLYTAYTYAGNDNDTLNAAGPVKNTRFIGENNNTFVAGVTHSF